MAMSRKTYEQVAEVIRQQVNEADQQATLSAIQSIADGLADLFRYDNPRFNRALFMEACDLG